MTSRDGNDIEYHTIGHYRKANFPEPAEYPEVVIDLVTDPDGKELEITDDMNVIYQEEIENSIEQERYEN